MIYTLLLGENRQNHIVLVIFIVHARANFYHIHQFWINDFRFSVAWYPIYRIPEGKFSASFLTYHLLGQSVVQSIPIDSLSKMFQIVFPVIGLQSYNTQVNYYIIWTQNILMIWGPDCTSTCRNDVCRRKKLQSGIHVITSSDFPWSSFLNNDMVILSSWWEFGWIACIERQDWLTCGMITFFYV